MKAETNDEVDRYLAALPEPQRRQLDHVRATIRAVAPMATESISYGIPAFKQDGRPLIYYSAWKRHCAIYGLPYELVERHRAELEQFERAKGTIRFTVEHPLPDDLLRVMVGEHLAALAARKG